MRTREEIEDEIHDILVRHPNIMDYVIQRDILEVLLDIRELLIKK